MAVLRVKVNSDIPTFELASDSVAAPLPDSNLAGGADFAFPGTFSQMGIDTVDVEVG